MNKNIKLKKAIAIVIITNIITASLLIFAPIPLIGGKRLVSNTEYNFMNRFSKLSAARSVLLENYVDKVDESKFAEGAVAGMVDSIGDPYTVYMNKKDFTDFMTQTQGSYAGIGIYIGVKDNKIVVVAPIESGPAEKAGIKSGDIIVKVNGKSVEGKDIDRAVSMMKGKEGVKVKVSIFREGKGNIDFELTTAKVTLKTVKGQIMKDNIGYMRISMFDEHTADSFVKELDKLQKQNMKGLILDLRDNPGGLLDQCATIADKLLGKGTIVYTIDNKGKKEVLVSDAEKLNVPLVILVNGGTASASEIVSGAVRDHKAGTLIGTTTFGKGLVQTLVKLGDGSAIKVTIARYYTPNGECIQKKGIKPDIVIDLPQKDKERFLTQQEDIQLQKAISVMKSKM